MEKTKTIELLDIYLSSFLILNGVIPKLEPKNGKIIFAFEADDRVYFLMNLFSSNTDVPVADFVPIIKSLRGKMLTAKERVNENGRGTKNGYSRSSTR